MSRQEDTWILTVHAKELFVFNLKKKNNFALLFMILQYIQTEKKAEIVYN
jgi:hypothetical protein